MSEPLGDACDELLRRVDKLETANGKLCESVNQLTHMVEERDESIHNLIALVDKRQAEIMKLTAERDELQERADYNSNGWAKANIGWAEANAEAEKWRMKCDELREKLSHAIGNAHDTLTLVDLDGDVL